jgi:hypothetical protein
MRLYFINKRVMAASPVIFAITVVTFNRENEVAAVFVRTTTVN